MKLHSLRLAKRDAKTHTTAPPIAPNAIVMPTKAAARALQATLLPLYLSSSAFSVSLSIKFTLQHGEISGNEWESLFYSQNS